MLKSLAENALLTNQKAETVCQQSILSLGMQYFFTDLNPGRHFPNNVILCITANWLAITRAEQIERQRAWQLSPISAASAQGSDDEGDQFGGLAPGPRLGRRVNVIHFTPLQLVSLASEPTSPALFMCHALHLCHNSCRTSLCPANPSITAQITGELRSCPLYVYEMHF
ncbi:unnamed protein product [Nippostrongylus brasiliensis]|uniref:FERM domain-containing protein n=1 Tax=Nippostrongylus brasiliensis TaxID=27835 RepID=A0A0N4YAW5_NIPBR|nr:unnamed protein product [Nippostrongylus brasiliensis]